VQVQFKDSANAQHLEKFPWELVRKERQKALRKSELIRFFSKRVQAQAQREC